MEENPIHALTGAVLRCTNCDATEYFGDAEVELDLHTSWYVFPFGYSTEFAGECEDCK